MIFPKEWSTHKKLLFAMGLAGKEVEDIATGNPLTFVTDLARPLKSLLIPFTPQQSGTGDPSPENIRSILPWNGLTVFGGGKNLLNPAVGNTIPFTNTNYNKYTLTDGVVVTSGNTLFGFKVKVKPNTTYRFTFDTSESVTMEIFSYTTEPSVIKNDDKQIINIANNTWQFTTFADTEWISCGIYTSKVGVTVRDFRLTAGSAQEPYEPYVPITETAISFPSPVYGGTLDVVSGVLTVDIAGVEFNGSDGESWNVGAIDENKSRAFIALAGAPKTGYNRDIIGNYIKPTASAQSSPDLWTANINASGNILIGIDPSITTVEAWKAYLAEHPLQIVYPLAEPQEQTLTGHQITALVGDNTIWSDADGQMTAVYLKKG